jgi:hypothetical protein
MNIIFVDLDHTLLDTFQETPEGLRAALTSARNRGLPQGRLDHMARCLEHAERAVISSFRMERVLVRPGAELALQAFRELGEVHVYTGADPIYARCALEAVGLLKHVNKVFTTRQENDFSFIVDKPWVLIDDWLAIEKLTKLGCYVAEPHLLRVDPLHFGDPEPVPLTNYIPEACAMLIAQHLRLSAGQQYTPQLLFRD